MVDPAMTASLTREPGQKLGTILHIGAGTCDALPLYLAAAPHAIVLIEPNPTLVAALQQRIAGTGTVTVEAVAIAGAAGERPLAVFNIAALSSLQRPSGLLAVYPGLRAVDFPTVRCVTLDAALAGIDLDASLAHWLIAEAPGAEPDILAALARPDIAALFDRILFRIGREPLFDGGIDAPNLLRKLRDCGYVIEDAWSDRAPEWQWFRLSRDPQRQALSESAAAFMMQTAEHEALRQDAAAAQTDHEQAAGAAAAQLAEATSRADALTTEVATLAAQAEALAMEREALRKDAAAAQTDHEQTAGAAAAQLAEATSRADTLTTEVATLAAQAEALAMERDALRKDAAAAQTDHEQAARAAAAQLAEATGRADTLAAEVATLAAQAEALAMEREKLRRDAEIAAVAQARLNDRLRKNSEMKAALDAEVFGWRKKLEAADEARAKLTAELDSKAKDLSFVLQSQVLARADYRDLQARYSQVYDTNRRQEDLLLKLTNRLGEAAIYLQRLTVGQSE